MGNSSLIQQLVEKVVELNPRQKQFLDKSLLEISENELVNLEAYISEQLDKGLSLRDLAESYNRIVVDTLAEQIFFKKEGRYRYSKFNEVAEAVYHDPKYMSQYMIGLALTQYFWSNHRQLFQFFCESINKFSGDRYLEIGTGHGLHFSYAVLKGMFDSYWAVDLSQTSIELTKNKVSGLSQKKDIHFKLCDFLLFESDAPFSFITMGEVLEHVEEPLRFIQKLKELLAPDGRVFISTCCNAPAVDHIFLFKNVTDVKELCRAGGFEVDSECIAPHPGLTLEQAEEKKYPINLALGLRHAR